MLDTATTPRVGRKMEFPERITLPLAAGSLARIDSALAEGEPRLELIRAAIEQELLRRARSKARVRYDVREIVRELKASPPTPPGQAKSKNEE